MLRGGITEDTDARPKTAPRNTQKKHRHGRRCQIRWIEGVRVDCGSRRQEPGPTDGGPSIHLPQLSLLQALGKTGWWNLREYRDGGERMGAVRNDHRPEQVGGSRQDAQGYLSH